MLPIKVLQMDYQDFGNFVWNHFDLIEKYQIDNSMKFNGIVSKLRNGTIPGSIIASYLDIPMGVLSAPRQTNYKDFELFLPKELRTSDTLNLLYVDSICGTGDTIFQVQKFFKEIYSENINLVTYSTLVDVNSKYKPDICGLTHERFFQPPWEWRSFTPQTHLDRLQNDDIKSSTEEFHSLGFSSHDCKSRFEQSLGKKIFGEWIEIFDVDSLDRKLQSASGISNLDIPKDSLTMELCKTKFAPLINAKVEFIQENGFTHFIESDCSQAIILSEKSTTTQILYFDGNDLTKIYGKNYDKSKIFNLKF